MAARARSGSPGIEDKIPDIKMADLLDSENILLVTDSYKVGEQCREMKMHPLSLHMPLIYFFCNTASVYLVLSIIVLPARGAGRVLVQFKTWRWFTTCVSATQVSHHKQYPSGTTVVFSYFESRGGKFPQVCFFGLQYLIKVRFPVLSLSFCAYVLVE